MKLYKSELTNVVVYFFLTIVLITICLLLFDFDRQYFGLPIVVGIYFLIMFVFKENPVRVIIDRRNNTINIQSRLYLFQKREKEFSLNNLTCSYDYKTGARGSKIRVFKIEVDKAIIFEMMPNIFGWSDETLNEIYHELSTSTN